MKLFIWDNVPLGITLLGLVPLHINAVQFAPSLYALRESLKREIDETTKGNTFKRGLQAMIDYDPSHVIDGERAFKNQLTAEEWGVIKKHKIQLEKLQLRGHNV